MQFMQHLIWVYTVCTGLSIQTLGVITVIIKGTLLHTCLAVLYNNKKKVLFAVINCIFNFKKPFFICFFYFN